MKACKAELDGVDAAVEKSSGSAAHKTLVDTNDGMFWMSYDDFARSFVSVSVCAVFPLQPGTTLADPYQLGTLPKNKGLKPSDYKDRTPPKGVARYVPLARPLHSKRGEWIETRVRSYFEPAQNGTSLASACRVRPAHFFHVAVGKEAITTQGAPCYFTLSQVDRRVLCAAGYVDVGLMLYRLPPGGGALKPLHWEPAAAGRNIMLEAYLEPGEYIVVPISGGARVSATWLVNVTGLQLATLALLVRCWA